MPPIYLDSNATTPIAEEVAQAMQPFLGQLFGNPSSGHFFGRQCKAAVDRARKQLAGLLGCIPEELIFTSGGTEANNMALRGLAADAKRRKIIISAVEHPAITEVCKHLSGLGYEIQVLPVDGYCLVNPRDLSKTIGSETLLVSVMLANNEVGSIQPIAELAEIAHEHGAIMHTDAAQAIGKISVNVGELGVDMLSLAGHKFYAPAGVGALYVRRGLNLAPLMYGAGHESGMRAGTENVLEIVGLGAAAELAATELPMRAAHMRAMRDRLEAGLSANLGGLHINGHPTKRLPNTSSVSFPGVEANTLLDGLDGELAASAGAACHTDKVDISAVLKAMGVPEEIGMGTVRLSTGRHSNEEEIDRAVEILVSAVTLLGAEMRRGGE